MPSRTSPLRASGASVSAGSLNACSLVPSTQGSTQRPPSSSAERPRTSTPSAVSRASPDARREVRYAYMDCSPPTSRYESPSLYKPPPQHLSRQRRESEEDDCTTSAGLAPVPLVGAREAARRKDRGLSRVSNADDGATEESAAAAAAPSPDESRLSPGAEEFTMEAYRKLHGRQFASTHEELDFLRRDFVYSRRTVALMHAETLRLQDELRCRVDEVASLQDKLQAYRRQLSRMPRGSRGCLTAPSEGFDGAAAEALKLAPEEEAPDGPDGASLHDEEGGSTPAATSASPLWLYAAAGAASRKHRQNARAFPGSAANELNTAELVTELRCNLARRDTAIEDIRTELGAAKKARDLLENDCRRARQEASAARQEQQSVLVTLNEKLLLLSEMEERQKAAERDAAAKEEQLEKLKSKCEVIDLLGDYPSLKSVDAGLTQHEYLLEQVKTYRGRWQAAEDRVDELNKQLVSERLRRASIATEGPPSPPSAAAADQRPPPPDGGAERLRLEEELRSQLETIRRLQRKLERETESSAFDGEQLRLQRQEEQRQHAAEVSALRDQLHAAREQLASEARDREALTRQLRRATHDEAMTETLQSQSAALKQRLSETAADLAGVLGRERELELSVQREKGERLRLTHTNEMLAAERAAMERKELIMQSTIEDLRRQLGGAQANTFLRHCASAEGDGAASGVDAKENSVDIPPSAATAAVPTRARPTGDAAAVASELKGYTALMTLNATLQERLRDAQEKLCNATQDAHAGPGAPVTEDAHCQQVQLLAEQAREQQENLQRLEDAHARLKTEWAALTLEHKQVLEDNIVLAHGIEHAHRELHQLKARSASAGSGQRTKRRESSLSRPTGALRPCVDPSARCDTAQGSRVRLKICQARDYLGVEDSGTALSSVRESLEDAHALKSALMAAQEDVNLLERGVTRQTCAPVSDAPPITSIAGWGSLGIAAATTTTAVAAGGRAPAVRLPHLYCIEQKN